MLGNLHALGALIHMVCLQILKLELKFNGLFGNVVLLHTYERTIAEVFSKCPLLLGS